MCHLDRHETDSVCQPTSRAGSLSHRAAIIKFNDACLLLELQTSKPVASLFRNLETLYEESSMRASETPRCFCCCSSRVGRLNSNIRRWRNNNNRNRNCNRASSRSSWLVVDAEMLGAAAAAVVVCFSFSNVMFPDEGESSCRRLGNYLVHQVAIVKSTSHVDGGRGMNCPSPACLLRCRPSLLPAPDAAWLRSIPNRAHRSATRARGFDPATADDAVILSLNPLGIQDAIDAPSMGSRVTSTYILSTTQRHVMTGVNLWSGKGQHRFEIIQTRRTDVLTWTVDVQRIDRLKCFDVVGFLWLENSEKWAISMEKVTTDCLSGWIKHQETPLKVQLHAALRCNHQSTIYYCIYIYYFTTLKQFHFWWHFSFTSRI